MPHFFDAIFTAFPTLVSLAYRPFLDPIPVDRFWMFFALPLVVVIALVYKSIRMNSLEHLTRETLKLSLQILIFMVAAAVVLWLIAALL